jgi:hypothetical protein
MTVVTLTCHDSRAAPVSISRANLCMIWHQRKPLRAEGVLVLNFAVVRTQSVWPHCAH